MNCRHHLRRLGRILAAAATLGSAAGLGFSFAGLSVGGLPSADAAPIPGVAAVVDANNITTPRSSGGSADGYRLSLPAGSATFCTGDTANSQYFLYSYVVPVSVPVASLRFDGSGPVPVAGQFRDKLFEDGSGTQFVARSTANQIVPNGPGQIIQPLPAFSFFVYEAPPSRFAISLGVYNVGIACAKGASISPTQLDRYWNVVMEVKVAPADPAGFSWQVLSSPSATATALSVSPGTNAAQGVEVALTATVSPATAAGSVTFTDGAKALGAAVAVTDGKAILKRSDLAVGDHPITATFVPTAAGTNASSISELVTYRITTATATTTTTKPGSTTTTVAGTGTGTGTSTGSGSGSGGTGVGARAASSTTATELAKTGGSFLAPVMWSFVLICLGRGVVLLGRRPPPTELR